MMISLYKKIIFPLFLFIFCFMHTGCKIIDITDKSVIEEEKMVKIEAEVLEIEHIKVDACLDPAATNFQYSCSGVKISKQTLEETPDAYVNNIECNGPLNCGSNTSTYLDDLRNAHTSKESFGDQKYIPMDWNLKQYNHGFAIISFLVVAE